VSRPWDTVVDQQPAHAEEALVSTVTAERLAEILVKIAETLADDFDLMDFLYQLTRDAAELLDAGEVGLMLADAKGDLQFVAASHERTETLELFELQVHEGPCVDVFATGAAVIDVDLATAGGRWPDFAARAVAAGFEVVHALPMRLRSQVIGALNVFTAPDRAVGPAELAILQAVADLTTIALLRERALQEATILAQQLQTGFDSRLVIERAKGALAQLHGIDAEDAFEVLRSYARRNRHKITDVAAGWLAQPERFPDLVT
jgi:GAF domain-containing protein